MICEQGWEALRGDSLRWLLDPTRPNVVWRALIDLIGRPDDSPAVRRARGGANASDPVASLLADLHPDGTWATDSRIWARYAGPGWRLVAAVQWGADPEDPRLHAASERLLEEEPGTGGLARRPDVPPDTRLTARALQAMVALGWRRHPRVQEWLAWFEATSGWERDPVAAVAVLAASRNGLRTALVERAVAGLGEDVTASRDAALARLGYPNLLRTDLAEIFGALAVAGIPWHDEWRPGLARLQQLQDGQGRWARRVPVPTSLAVPSPEQPSGFLTLSATTALLAYAVVAGLPRMFPPKPAHLDD